MHVVCVCVCVYEFVSACVHLLIAHLHRAEYKYPGLHGRCWYTDDVQTHATEHKTMTTCNS